jgi:hypothetical protein
MACGSAGPTPVTLTPLTGTLSAEEATEAAIVNASHLTQGANPHQTSAELTTYSDAIDRLGGAKPEPAFAPPAADLTWIVRMKGIFPEPPGPPGSGPVGPPACREIVVLLIDSTQDAVRLSVEDSDSCS